VSAPLVDAVQCEEGTMLTASRVVFSLARPRPEDVRLEDIAQGLSLTNRYSGQTKVAYCVAQHAVLVARSLRASGATPAEQLWGLHHDDAEAYVGDVTRPLKRLLRQGNERSVYDVIEDNVMGAIAEALGLEGTEQPAIVSEYDKRVGAREQIDLGRVPAGWVPLIAPAHCVVEPWAAERARREFLVEHERLEREVRRG
jgi:hypothetical protein